MLRSFSLFFYFIVFFITTQAEAKAPHSHDLAQVQFALEKGQGLIEVRLPATLVIGFEHKPRHAKETHRSEKALKEVAQLATGWFQFEPQTSCLATVHKTDWKHDEDNHSEVVVELKLSCSSPLEGTRLTLNLKKSYPKLHEIRLEVLLEKLQKSWVLKKNQTEVTLK